MRSLFDILSLSLDELMDLPEDELAEIRREYPDLIDNRMRHLLRERRVGEIKIGDEIDESSIES